MDYLEKNAKSKGEKEMNKDDKIKGLKKKLRLIKSLTARVFAQYIPDTKNDLKLEELKTLIKEKN